MIEKIRRPQQFNKQEMQIPRNIQELMQRYDLDNMSGFDGKYSSLSGTPTIPTKTSELTNDSGYSTENWVTNEITKAVTGGTVDLSGYAEKTYVDNKLATKSDTSHTHDEYVTETELNNKGYLTNVPSTYKTKAENDELYQEKGNYLTSYTETDPTVPSHVKSITATNISNWNNKSDFSGDYNDLTNQPAIPTKTSELTNDSKFSTESWVSNEIAKAVTGGTVDLSGYAEKTYVDSQLENKADADHKHNEYLTEIPSEYITETELNAKGYLTDIPSEYITETELSAKGYLTEHQDISSKADKTDLITHTSNNDIHITATDKANWNAKSDFSGNYNDLTNQPTIPTVPTDVSAFTNDAGYITSDSEKFNEYLPRSGGTMTKKIVFDNKSEYEAIQKTRTIDGVDYVARVGVGNVNGGTVSFELASNGEVLGRLDVLADGSIRNGITRGILIDSTDSRVRQRCAMTVYLSSDQTIPANNAPFINLNTVETSLGLGSLLGSDLELSGNAILCKRAGVIEVSGSVGFSGLAVGGNVQIRTFKNKSTQITNLQTRVSNTGDQSFGTQTKIVAVEANTLINLYVGNWSSNAITAKAGSQLTFLSVRYID